MSAFQVTRSVTVHAEPGRVHALVDDFRAWTRWSPWEEVDPAMVRTYSGPSRGVGARYAWDGDRRAGRGRMEITASTPAEVRIRLTFLKPWTATHEVTFALTPADGGTRVTWAMTGRSTGPAALVTRLLPMDRLVGRDFDRGLARLKALAEA